MAAEDFAYNAQKALSTVGIHNESAGLVFALHSPECKADPVGLSLGAAVHAACEYMYTWRSVVCTTNMTIKKGAPLACTHHEVGL